MTKKFKVGDRVRLIDACCYYGATGVLEANRRDRDSLFLTFDDPSKGWLQDATDPSPGKGGGWVGPNDIEHVDNDTISLGTKSIADDLRLTPQARKVLSHLRAGKSISPLEAQNVYGVYRLAGRILEIRRAGYNVMTQCKQDEAGHKYGRYSLAS